MTKESLKVLYDHRLELGKPVDDILKRYPEFALKPKEKKDEKPKRRATKRIHSDV